MIGMMKKKRDCTPEKLPEFSSTYQQETEAYTLDYILRVLVKGPGIKLSQDLRFSKTSGNGANSLLR